MLFVNDEQVTNKLQQLFGALNQDATLTPTPQQQGGTPATPQQQQQVNKMEMVISEQTAQIVAWSHLGYQFPIRGMAITSVTSWSAAAKILRPNDVIVQAAGQAITSTTTLQTIVREKGIGALIPLVVERGDQQVRVAVRTVRNPQLAGQHAAIGVGIEPYLDLTQLPSDPTIAIDPGNVGGPSAGLAFTLGILQRFSKTDLTHGHRIAVTGQLEANGQVDAIGGAKQKTIGARWAGAQYFILPADNYAEARPYAHGLTLVPVHTVDDALKFLQNLH